MQNISQMKYTYTYDNSNMIIVVMKLYDYILKEETNYGTLFCEITTDIYPIRFETIGSDSIYGNIAFTFYSASPSYISCDGEYRSQFTRYRTINKLKQIYHNIWNEVEEYISRIRTKRQWSLYASYFYPKLEQHNRNSEVEYSVKHEMALQTILTISWFNTIFEEMIGMTKSHINQKYKDIFLKEKDDDIAFVKSLIDIYGADQIEAFKSSFSDISTPGFQNTRKYMQCGYKMIPLNIKEVQEPFKIRYKPWREYLVSIKCNDLILNSIAPGFSTILDWFYIKNMRKGLYDNKSQYDRLKNSELAKDILQSLYEAQNGTYFASESLKGMSKSSGQIKHWINDKFRKLSEKIDDPINYSIEEIIMSEVTTSVNLC